MGKCKSKIKVKTLILEIEFNAVLDECCNYGSALKSCSNHTFDISHKISSDLHDLCRSNIEYCCEKNKQEANCQAGKSWAKFQPSCINKKRSKTFKVI